MLYTDSWRRYFKHRVDNYLDLDSLQQQTGLSTSFTLLDINHDYTVDNSADILIVAYLEDWHRWNLDKLEKAISRPLEECIILGASFCPDTLFSTSNPNFCFTGDWFQSPVDIVQQTVESKKYLYDCLIGKQGQDNNTLFSFLESKNVLAHSIYRYGNKASNDFNSYENNIDGADLQYYTSTRINDDVWQQHFGEETTKVIPSYRSRIVPKHMYKRSLASIVRETSPEVYTCFPTEKTAKPIHCKRLYFSYGPLFSNKNLKSLGFNIYDYSNVCAWDRLHCPKKRAEVFAEYCASHTQDSLLKLYETEKHNIQHNYELINKNWTQQAYDFVLDKIFNK